MQTHQCKLLLRWFSLITLTGRTTQYYKAVRQKPKGGLAFFHLQDIKLYTIHHLATQQTKIVQMHRNSQSCRSLAAAPDVPCIYHPEHLVQNFCQNNECLLPMCAICVGIHACEHQSRQTFPKICGIGEAVIFVRREIESLCSRLEETSQIFTSDYTNKQKMQEECYKMLSEIKGKVLREIQLEFHAVEARMYQQIERFDAEIHARYQQIERQTEEIYHSLQNQLGCLGTKDGVMKTLIRFHAENLKSQAEIRIKGLQHVIEELKKQSIKITFQSQLFDLLSKVGTFIRCEQQPGRPRQTTLTSPRQMTQTSPRSLFSEINFHYGTKHN